ncbi:hypothetical protein [Weissella koreensis]|uniref:hypothetical protein n=1 Tax=Weissella koreensis TaxID=165096 RepID=UPI0012B483BF|nr:hypothetical protein [Weissella koreensis]QGN19955.1 hypothetical protein GKC51_01260 [Weissella koreensis]
MSEGKIVTHGLVEAQLAFGKKALDMLFQVTENSKLQAISTSIDYNGHTYQMMIEEDD